MPIAKSSNNTSSLNKLSDDISNQLQADFIKTTPVEKPEIQNDIQTVAPVAVAAEIPSKGNSDTVIARLSKGKRSEFKSFFAKYGVTMTGGIEMCIEYVMRQVDLGNLVISKAGVNEKI